MNQNSSYFGVPGGNDTEIVSYEFTPMPDGSTRSIKRTRTAIVTDQGILVQSEKVEILCEHKGDRWIQPGRTGGMLDGKFVCWRCRRQILRSRFFKKMFLINPK